MVHQIFMPKRWEANWHENDNSVDDDDDNNRRGEWEMLRDENAD